MDRGRGGEGPATEPARRDGGGARDASERFHGPHAIEIAIVPSRFLRVLLIVIALLVALSTATQAVVYYAADFPVRDAIASLFYVDLERNVPTLFSSLLLLVSALLCGAIGDAHRRRDRSDLAHWSMLAVVFAVLALDEFAALHERSGEPIRELLGVERGPLAYTWVVPAVLVVVVFAIVLVRFLSRLPRSTRRGLLTAGALFVGGAIGVEMLSAWWDADHGVLNMTHVLIVTVEEALEMLGIALLLYTLLAYIPVGLPDADWRVQVVDPSRDGHRGPRRLGIN